MMGKLSRQKDYLHLLPSPVSTFHIDGVIFDIFQAKPLYTPRWNHPTLKQIVRHCRETYLVYGPVPLLDAYDAKAAIYLCRARYYASMPNTTKRVLTEEWLSTRFIPGDSRPASTEDLDQYLYRRRKISYWLKQKFFIKNKKFLHRIITISRICGLTPFPAGASPWPRPSLNGLRYTAVAFILMNHQFLSDYRDLSILFFTAVFRRKLLDKILNPTSHNARRSLFFSSAAELFQCDPDQIVLNRNVMAYRFPGYFLNVFDILKMCKKLNTQGKLPFSVLHKYMKRFSLDLFDSAFTMPYMELLQRLRGLDKLLLAKGRIGRTFTGQALRRIIKREVGDGPELKIMPVEKWRRQLAWFTALTEKKCRAHQYLITMPEHRL